MSLKMDHSVDHMRLLISPPLSAEMKNTSNSSKMLQDNICDIFEICNVEEYRDLEI